MQTGLKTPAEHPVGIALAISCVPRVIGEEFSGSSGLPSSESEAYLELRSPRQGLKP